MYCSVLTAWTSFANSWKLIFPSALNIIRLCRPRMTFFEGSGNPVRYEEWFRKFENILTVRYPRRSLSNFLKSLCTEKSNAISNCVLYNWACSWIMHSAKRTEANLSWTLLESLARGLVALYVAIARKRGFSCGKTSWQKSVKEREPSSAAPWWNPIRLTLSFQNLTSKCADFSEMQSLPLVAHRKRIISSASSLFLSQEIA